MTQIEKEALLLFKEYSFLQLKSFRTNRSSEMSEIELECLDKAIEYYRDYNKLKLQLSKIKKGSPE